MSGTCYLSGMQLNAEDNKDSVPRDSVETEPLSDDLSSAGIEILNQFDDQEALKAKITYSTSYSFTLIFNDAICAGMSFETSSSLVEKVTLNLIGLTEFFDLKYIIIKDKGIITILKRYSQRRQTLSKPKIDPQTFYSKGKKTEGVVVFESFSRQELAFRHFDELLLTLSSDCSKLSLKLFAFESLMTGKRQFLVADLKTFMTRYLNLEAPKRHVYELIRQDFPCRLYFDLEFSIPANPDTNGQELVDRWIHIVTWKLYEVYGLIVGRGNFIDLDSSSDTKFSRHVTVLLLADEDDDSGNDVKRNHVSKRRKVNKSSSLLPSMNGKEYLFRNNIECGYFVDLIVDDALLLENSTPSSTASDDPPTLQLPRAHCHKKSLNPINSSLFVWNKECSAKTCFVDLGVYTRNRVFRLFSSCKHGKTSRLKVTPTHSITTRSAAGSTGDGSVVNYFV